MRVGVGNRLYFKLLSIFGFACFLGFLALRPALVLGAERLVSVGLSAVKGAQQVNIETDAVNVFLDAYGMPVYSFDSTGGFQAVLYGNAVALNRGGETVALLESPLIQGIDGFTVVGGVRYRGFIRLVPRGGGLLVINLVDEESYLMGVVPAEMPATWHIEALKAQAVAARSYLRTQAGVHAADGYDLCDTIHCQVYKGASGEAAGSTEAVLQTAGVLAYYDGKPINAVFFSSSGGFTENSENVWTETVPYLRGVREVAEKEFSEWTRSFTLAELSAGLAAKGAGVGQVVSVTVDYFPSGRASRITFNGTGGSKSYEKDAVRGFCSEIGGSLRSSMFVINGYAPQGESGTGSGVGGAASGSLHVLGAYGSAVKNASEVFVQGATEAADNLPNGVSVASYGEVVRYGGMSAALPENGSLQSVTVNSDTLVFNGRGYGHGAGMSQYGAKGMAESGYDYIGILKHYYTGIEVY